MKASKGVRVAATGLQPPGLDRLIVREARKWNAETLFAMVERVPVRVDKKCVGNLRKNRGIVARDGLITELPRRPVGLSVGRGRYH